MTVFQSTPPWGFTVFCDDVRLEANGKLLYIGVYPGDMVIYGILPALIPSFAALVRYSEKPGESTDRVTIKVFPPGGDDPIVAIELDTVMLRSTNLSTDVPNEEQLVSSLVPIRISPMPIEHEGRIRVRAYRGNDEIRLGTLNVRVLPPNQVSIPSPPT